MGPCHAKKVTRKTEFKRHYCKRLDSTDDDRSIGEDISRRPAEISEEEESGEESGEEESGEEESGEEESGEEEGAIAELSDSDDDFHGDEGEEFGEYRLMERLGKGGYSVVWKAQKKDEAPVALKIGKEDDAEDLETEIEALKRIGTHPNVLTHLAEFSQTIDVVHRTTCSNRTNAT